MRHHVLFQEIRRTCLRHETLRMCVCVCVRVYVMGYIQVVCVMWCAAYVVWCVVCGVRVCVGVGVGVEYE